jgi:CRISPR-associated exonuclease Cas4
MKYSDDELLLLSGIQHFAFCERQWALIHIEQQWVENLSTIQGKHLHERADMPGFFEKRGGVLTVRALSLISYELGFTGKADVVEFHSAKSGIQIPGKQGYWRVIPVEYKRGKPKKNDIDEVQLCAQAMCLEEMLNTTMEKGYIFYGETRRRETVYFEEMLRFRVEDLSKQMHKIYNERSTPRAEKRKNCYLCSLYNVCLPKISNKWNSVQGYLKKHIVAQDGEIP